jgi:hypothetical protein
MLSLDWFAFASEFNFFQSEGSGLLKVGPFLVRRKKTAEELPVFLDLFSFVFIFAEDFFLGIF